MSDEEKRSELTPGWYARLEGAKVDLEDWLHNLIAPFTPTALKEADGNVILASDDLDLNDDAETIRERAIGLISRLNGTMNAICDAGPISLYSIFKVDEMGKRHHHISVIAATMVVTMGRATVRAVGVALGPDGKPLPPPPPQPSEAQKWVQIAASNDVVADLLEQLGRSKDWYDIYKTVELAEDLAGGEQELKKILGDAGGRFKNLKTTANFYRHARGFRPAKPTSITEAVSLLRYIVRRVVEGVDSTTAKPH